MDILLLNGRDRLEFQSCYLKKYLERLTRTSDFGRGGNQLRKLVIAIVAVLLVFGASMSPGTFARTVAERFRRRMAQVILDRILLGPSVSSHPEDGLQGCPQRTLEVHPLPGA